MATQPKLQNTLCGVTAQQLQWKTRFYLNKTNHTGLKMTQEVPPVNQQNDHGSWKHRNYRFSQVAKEKKTCVVWVMAFFFLCAGKIFHSASPTPFFFGRTEPLKWFLLLSSLKTVVRQLPDAFTISMSKTGGNQSTLKEGRLVPFESCALIASPCVKRKTFSEHRK